MWQIIIDARAPWMWEARKFFDGKLIVNCLVTASGIKKALGFIAKENVCNFIFTEYVSYRLIQMYPAADIKCVNKGK